MYPQFYINKRLEDGTKLELRIVLIDGDFRLENIGVKPKGKRIFRYVCGSTMTNDYDYRRLSAEERKKYQLRKMVEVCPLEIINEAIEEAWLQIKPKKIVL